MTCATRFLSILTILACGCGGASEETRPRASLHPGSPEAPPAMTVLPDADVQAEALAPRMQEALALAEEAMGLQMPTPPAAADATQMQDWTETHLEPWIGRKTHAIEGAVEQLVEAAHDGPREQIMAAAVIALLYEDIARSIRAIPTPSDLERDTEIATVYREVVEHYARPYAGRAHIAYRNCIRDTRHGPPGMRHWAEFCDVRRERLDPGGS